MGKTFIPQVDSIETLLTRGPSFDELYDAQGRYSPGDGGGGIVEVRQSGTETDGGTVFMFDEDLTQVSGASSIDHTNLSWRKTKVRYGPDSNDVVGMLHLSGFHQNKAGQAEPWIDLKNGAGAGGGWNPISDWASNLGDGRQEFTYAHTNSDRRLERIGVKNGVSPAMWGAEENPSNPTQQDAYIRWAMIAASRHYANTSSPWGYVNIDGIYYYLHQLELLDGVLIRGTAGTDVDNGMPAKYQDSYTKGILRVVPGEALDYRLSNYDLYGADANSREDIYNQYGDLSKVKPTVDKGTSKFGFKNVKMDGNVRSNMQFFDNLGDYERPQDHMQNSGSWYGFSSTFFNVPDPTEAVWRGVNMTDMGGSGYQLGPDADKLVPAGDNTYIGKNVDVYDARRNHLLYGLVGDYYDDITIQGQYWGGTPILDPRGKDVSATVTNLTAKNIEQGQFDFAVIVADRGAAGPDGGLTLDGFTIDLTTLVKTGSPLGILRVNDRGSTFKNGTIRGLEAGNHQAPFYADVLNQNQFNDNVQHPTLLKNIDIFDEGSPINVYNDGFGGIRDLRMENITLKTAADFTPSGTRVLPFGQKINPRSDSGFPPSDRAWRIEHTNVDVELPTDFVFSTTAGPDIGPPFYPFDWYNVGGSDNSQNEGIHEHNQFDVYDEFDPDGRRAVRLFLNDYTTNLNDGSEFHQDLRPDINQSVRVRNLSDRSGHTSDQVNQSYTATSEDETNGYALIPTNLISRAWETSVTASAGYNVTGVEIANADGTLRADDNTGQTEPYLKVSVDGTITQGDTFTWTARVTPTARYQTSGAFIARRLYDRTSGGVYDPFTSGSGPFTVNLVGVASAQDMDMMAKPTYTASSGDTSVVTANVQGDGYTLELTEQSAGTATITVTGEIPGVGTAQTSFQVEIQ